MDDHEAPKGQDAPEDDLVQSAKALIYHANQGGELDTTDIYTIARMLARIKKLQAEVQRARDEEREAIAREVATWRNVTPMTGEECAAAIRALREGGKDNG